MNKSERLTDMMIYLNDKKSFNLKHLMDRYEISKSTALRDIQSLEAIGMPIFSRPGRHGYYGILPNRLLSPIVFTVDEVHALYFAMQTLNAYQSTPFHLSVQQLKQKFERCISEEQKEKLRSMETIFRLGSYQTMNECSCLRELLDMAVNETVCKVQYTKDSHTQVYYVQYFDITSAYGQWYATGYNYQAGKPQVFRCDKIQTLKASNTYAARPLSEFLIPPRELFRDKAAVDFEVSVSPKGADLFYKEHYPSMELHRDKEHCCIRGFYNPGEERFIAAYFAAYGETICAIKPKHLKHLILERLDTIKDHLRSV